MLRSRLPLTLPLLAGPLLLAACHTVPEVTRVPVPAGPTVFHGTYSGTLTEALDIAAAAPSPDGAQLYVAASTSGHTTLLVLDPATGQERQRVSVPVASPRDLMVQPGGVLVLAGRGESATLDPATLQVLTRLPGAERISADGQRLLTVSPAGDVGRVRTADGQRVPTAALTLAWGNVESVSRDLEWAATENGDALLNLSTGARIDTSAGHLNPCPTGALPAPRPVALATSGEGFVIGRGDRTLEWRGWDGKLREARWLDTACTTTPPNWALTLQGDEVGYRLHEGGEGAASIGRWVPGTAPGQIARTEGAADWGFGSTFALGRPEAYLQRLAPGIPGLRLGGRWEQAYERPRFPVTTEVTASARTPQQYGLEGTLKTLGTAYALRGTGNARGENGSIVFTQAVCGLPPFAPNCPTTGWEAEVLQGGQKVGELLSTRLDPNRAGAGRAVQEGSLRLTLDGEERSFAFWLTPEGR